jgi:hypothetical protein
MIGDPHGASEGTAVGTETEGLRIGRLPFEPSAIGSIENMMDCTISIRKHGVSRK